METVLKALEAMGKATSRELAARLDINREEVVTELWELKRAGVVTKNGPFWSLSDGSELESENVGEMPAPRVTEQHLTEALEKHGPQTADELASMFGVTPRKVASTLAMATKKSRVHRVAKNGRYRYYLPNQRVLEMMGNQGTSEAEPQPEIAAKTEHKADGVEAVISTDKRAEDLIIPNVRYISNEIRRTKAKLERLYKLRDAAREVSKLSLVLKQLNREVTQ
ncbi:TPA: DUF1627 domain-containing protein [Citrobacter freundii]